MIGIEHYVVVSSILFVLGVLGLVVCPDAWVTELYAPLAPVGDRASPAYATLAGLSTFMAAVAAFKMGRGVSLAYEKIAIEVALRREELCSESEGRTLLCNADRDTPRTCTRFGKR